MADTEAERTEEATQKRRDEAREEGRVPKSQELTIAVSLLGSAIAISALTPMMGRSLLNSLGEGLSQIGTLHVDAESAPLIIRDTFMKTGSATLALLLALAAATLAIAALQARGVFSLKSLEPKFERISPAANIKNLVGVRTVVELIKSIAKVAIVGFAVWGSIKTAIPESVTLSQTSQLGFLFLVKKYAIRMLASAGGAYLALAAADYMYQWYQHEQSLKMTKEEVKQEMKQSDGDPHIKQRRRALARQYARKQMMKDVPKADVVIVNPTHIAIAIKYDPAVAPAPYILAIGMNKVAERIKAIAAESGVPMVENRPVARALLKTAKVGTMIPYEMYLAVAEVLAFVIRTRGKLGASNLNVRA
ncbi:MAG TPA: EscU/YscU/HrcU family type III secretion system export apparatus switch protein [Gemmatimonadaceae bacterium]|jgi:flagellar biosynthetic protein FlhB